MASTNGERHQRFPQRDVPPEILAVPSLVSNDPRQYGQRSLPLNIVASIIGYLDDIADIARMTRTCRLMYYMALPQLYEKVTLYSHSELRYIDGKPEGFGSGSPFTMALGGLTTNNSANLVQEFRVVGSWPEPRMEEYMMGKVPDSTVLLGIAFRAAIDRMTTLKSFRWELDAKPLKTVYQGLAARNSLAFLDIRFPSNRMPRPITTVPPMPNLRKLRVTNIDPLCYPDDLSVLLLQGKKLEDLRLQWSPRMREEAEPSTNLRLYFGKCLEAKYRLPLKHIGLQNFYGANTGDLQQICDPKTIRSSDFINCFGGSQGGQPATIFIDDTWNNVPVPELFFQNFKQNRISEPAEQHARILSTMSGLEELYFVHVDTPSQLNGMMNGASKTPTGEVTTPKSGISCLYSSPGRTLEQANAALCKQYLQVLFTHHGHALRKLLLHDQWALSGSQISELVSSCPNLEELGLGLSEDEPGAMRILAPFLKNVRSIRILQNDWLDKARQSDPELMEVVSPDAPNPQLWKIPPMSKIQWSGIGGLVFRMGKSVQVLDEDGRVEWKTEVWRATLDDVKHIDIWRLDCLDI